jgi:rhamnogalacturonyl hydrolase YesR
LDLDIPQIFEKAKELASHSWEYGTLAETLLEVHNPELSVFSVDAFPADKVPSTVWAEVQGLEYAHHFIDLNSMTLADGEGSAADPCSLGVPTIMLGQSDVEYLKAAQRQFNHLRDVPRIDTGGISHLSDIAEAWSDFIAMVPPFMAYYAVVSSDIDLMDQTVEQVRFYRSLLRDPKSGLWKHILGPRNEDRGFWTTGNGWAAMGMARTLATIRHWSPAASREQGRGWDVLPGWIKEIVDGVIAADNDKSELLRNYMDEKEWFGEISGTALIAATAYRMAVLDPAIFGAKYVQWADKKAAAVMKHVDHQTGIASPVVNPLDRRQKFPEMMGSSEGESFVLMLYAAHRDYLDWKSMTS